LSSQPAFVDLDILAFLTPIWLFILISTLPQFQ